MRTRLWTSAVVGAALVVFAAAGYVIAHHEHVPRAGQTPGYVATTPPPVQPGAGTQASGSTTGPAPARTGTRRGDQPIVAFLGDDYTAGDGASGKSKRFSTLVSARLGLSERNFAVPGGGYARRSENGKTYADLLDAVVAARPNAVVVSGGRNDKPDAPATLAEHARQLFAQLHQRLPHATLIAIAPWWGDSDAPPELAGIADAIRTAVHDAGGHYLALPDPLHGHPQWMADAADPNDTGYAHIAAALEPALAPLLPVRPLSS